MNSQNKQKEPEKIVTQEEALDDKLRYLYMMKALHPSLRNKIDIHFKVKKSNSTATITPRNNVCTNNSFSYSLFIKIIKISKFVCIKSKSGIFEE